MLCAIVPAIARGDVGQPGRVSSVSTTQAFGITAKLIRQSDALPPVEGYDRSYTPRVRLYLHGKLALADTLPSGSVLDIEGPLIARSPFGPKTVTLVLMRADHSWQQVTYSLSPGGSFRKTVTTADVHAPTLRTRFDTYRTASNGSINVAMRYEQNLFLLSAPTLAIGRRGNMRSYGPILSEDHELYGQIDGPLFVDVDGDGEAELVFTALTRGAACCAFTILYAFDPVRGRYRRYDKPWGYYKNAPRLARYHKEHAVIFAAVDESFSEDAGAAGYLNGIGPVQLWKFRHRVFVNVTRNYRAIIREDASHQLGGMADANDPFARRAHCAAYLADRFLLGEGRSGWAVVRQHCPDNGGDSYATLRKALRAGGYTN